VSKQPEALRLAGVLEALNDSKKLLPCVGGQTLGTEVYQIRLSGADAGELLEAADELRRLHAVNAELLEALKFALENGCQTVYAHESDEIGNRGCCDELSYRPHSPDCWTVKARAAIAKAKEVKP
jgi:hypothetical protein